jgi:multicomponent Na+:H+ antiporter subunit B
MTSLILRTTARLLRPLLLLFSLFILFRGHNQPGGGFVGGLMAAAAFALQAISTGVESARSALRVDPHVILGTGLLVAVVSGLPALVFGQPFMTGQWLSLHLPLAGEWKLSTVMLFDIGVYLVVLGSVVLVIFTLAEE